MEKNETSLTKDNTSFTSKDWLQKLKNESWEAELLVSAIAIFGTFQLFKVINWTTNWFIDILDPSQYIVAYFIVFFGLIAISTLVAMFVIHFFLRAYWIGLVGLNSVFPDYSIEDSAYSKIYTEKILSILPKLTDSIEKVDKLCSVIFSVAFTLLLMLTYMAFFASVYLLLFNLLSEYISIYILLIPLIIFLIVYTIQMIISIVANVKKYKEDVKIQTWYFKIVKIGSIFMLGPLYKNILQITMIFGSNFKKNKALTKLIIAFMFSGMLVSFFKIKDTNIFYLIGKSFDITTDYSKPFSSFYKTENKDIDFLLTPQLESDVVTTKLTKLFIPIFEHERNSFQKNCPEFEDDDTKTRNENRIKGWQNKLDCYNNYHQILINDKIIEIDFNKYYHPKTKQFGIICYLKATDFVEGKNILTVNKINAEENSISKWLIPFQYYKNY
ncbi:hypothetical protein [Polaribacter sp. SA4-12]|uniref:hypothetical protein n=1 Tax=Polaribacter sp. SA4-12 TaxID=1312072 RepID=UPI000B3C7148|nr:hypothetical protein [Polaribacter sp. SA4-12]ARV15214.1 hypothetical protein BTO07_08670 [Polaribacter sp. SA4-12]